MKRSGTDIISQDFTGSLFSFADVSFLNIKDNTFERILPMANVDFFQSFSSIYTHLSQGIDSSISEGSYTSSSSLLVSVNSYSISMSNLSFSEITAANFTDSSVLSAQDGVSTLTVTNSSFLDFDQVA